MMSTIDYFWVLGWGFMALIIIIWFTRPPFVKSGMPAPPQQVTKLKFTQANFAERALCTDGTIERRASASSLPSIT